jgi:hypothetical protein
MLHLLKPGDNKEILMFNLNHIGRFTALVIALAIATSRLSMSRSLASSGFCFFLHSVVVSLSLLSLVTRASPQVP